MKQSLPSSQGLQNQASATAQSLATQASALAHQAVDKLPASVSTLLPTSIVDGLSSSTPAVPSHQSQVEITPETRETTSAPILESQSERPSGVMKPLIPNPTSTSSELPTSESNADSWKKPHKIGTFEATGKFITALVYQKLE